MGHAETQVSWLSRGYRKAVEEAEQSHAFQGGKQILSGSKFLICTLVPGAAPALRAAGEPGEAPALLSLDT